MQTIFRSLAFAAALVAMPALGVPVLADELGPITVVAHVDIIPDFLAQGLPLLQQFATQSKSDPGVKAFVLITWAPTTNHFQLIEVYDSLHAFNVHLQAQHTIAFRTNIQPYIGAPYDERRYISADQSETVQASHY